MLAALTEKRNSDEENETLSENEKDDYDAASDNTDGDEEEEEEDKVKGDTDGDMKRSRIENINGARKSNANCTEHVIYNFDQQNVKENRDRYNSAVRELILMEERRRGVLALRPENLIAFSAQSILKHTYNSII